MLFVKLVALNGRYGFTIRLSISPFLLTKLSLNSAEDGTFTYAFREGTNIGNLGGGINLVFIEADHTNEAQSKDYFGIRTHCAPDAVYMFHDVMVCQMLPSFKEIASATPTHKARVLTRTASGIGLLAPKDTHADLHRVLDAYCDPCGTVPV